MKSNYLKSIAPEPEKKEEEETKDEEEKKEEKVELTNEEKEEMRAEQIRQAMERAAKAQQCYFNLGTESIYQIF